jgi:hypothetical protein
LQNPSPKIIREKWTGSVAQVVEHLFESVKPRVQTPVLITSFSLLQNPNMDESQRYKVNWKMSETKDTNCAITFI